MNDELLKKVKNLRDSEQAIRNLVRDAKNASIIDVREKTLAAVDGIQAFNLTTIEAIETISQSLVALKEQQDGQ